ncbi:MAG: hypothetical protein GXX96_07645 [Planctomycetaceae bacterium]|nr:hypothetical protein [Planctomycetaceae bacterium]
MSPPTASTPIPKGAPNPAAGNGTPPPFLEYLNAGFSFVPIRADGSKKAACSWKQFTQRRPMQNHAEFWATRYKGVAIVGGTVSGNLETIDIDAAELVEPFEASLETEATGLLAKLCQTQTPRQDAEGRHGRHYTYRSAVPVAGNTKLALSEPRPQFNADGTPLIDRRTGQQVLKPETLIETRGEGGYFLTVGCSPQCHTTGNLYQHVGGPSLTALSVLTEAERTTIWRVAKSFSRYAESGKTSAKAPSHNSNGTGKKPGDDFNERATWEEILEPIGWTKAHNYGGLQYWTRPGKSSGISGTTGMQSADGNELFVCFSQNAHPFNGTNEQGQPGKSYNKFSAYALLNHGGDFKAAAKDLGKQGYGTPAKKTKTRQACVMRDDPSLPNTTDLGNAKRFAAQHGDDCRYCYPWGKWLVFDGTRWQTDQVGEIERRAKQTALSIYAEAAIEPNDGEREKLIGWGKKSESLPRLQAMVSLAQSEDCISIMPDDLNQHPWLFNTKPGTIDLKTGKLQPHRREDYLTQISPVDFDLGAKRDRWERFLEEIFLGDRDLCKFLQRLAGYCLTGSTRDHILPILYGTGSNGKTTYIETTLAYMGPDYGLKAPADFLMAKQAVHPTEKTDLFGRRFVACVETEDNRRLAESFVKEITGGDRIRARRMREDFWEFSATHKVWLATNHKPRVRGTDEGIWRRNCLIPFRAHFEGEAKDDRLPEILLDELPGILAWAVEGCLEWQRVGLDRPGEVQTATSEYRRGEDSIAGFIAEACCLGSSESVRATDLLHAYRDWVGDKGMSQKRFGDIMTEREFDRTTINGKVWYIGIGLLPDFIHEM